jgi:hemolysin activation/secretion protein
MLKPKTHLLFFLLAILSTRPSLALSPEEQSLHLQQQLIQQQEQLRQREQQRQNIRETDRIRNNRVKNGIVEDNKIELDKEKIKCSPNDINCLKEQKLKQKQSCPYRFDRIELKGNKAYSTKTLYKKVLNNYIDKCITKENMQKLQTELTNF